MIGNFQISLVSGQRSGLEIRLLSFQPRLCITVKVRLVAFLDAVLELFLKAFGLGHNILLNPTFGDFRRYGYRLGLHPFLPVDLIAVADCDFEFAFGFLFDVSHI